jgi:hypothetical protein
MDHVGAFLKEVAALGAALAFFWGVYQFRRSTELGFRKPYWERLLALYIEVCSATAVLAKTRSQEDWEVARNTFWKLYYGPLCLVEDNRVEEAMVQFGEALGDIEFTSDRKAVLSHLSLRLAYACRNSIRADWRVPLEYLEGQRKVQ